MQDIKILIVEDEILIAEDIKETLHSLGFKSVSMAHNIADALTMIRELELHVVLLDVRLENEREGILIGEQLSHEDKVQFIYVTAHSDVEIVKEILRTNPAGYITKPVKKSDLYACIILAVSKFEAAQQETTTIAIKDGYETVLLPLNTIRYVEAEGNYLNIYCDAKKYVIRQSLETFLKDVNNAIFFRIHRSFIVNIQKVVRFSKKEIILSENTILPISRTVKDEFEDYIKNRRV